MRQPVGSDSEEQLISILQVLSESSEPLGARLISRKLEKNGIFLGERGVRYHLATTDSRGYTLLTGRDGRMITPKGRQEIKEALAPQQLGFIREKLEILAYQTTFNPEKRAGLLPVNTSLINKTHFKKAILAMKNAFKTGICVSDLVAIASEGEKLGSVVIPEGKIGISTVSSTVLNGVLLHSGITSEYQFGGLLEIRKFTPKRFVAIIEYSSTSLDPSEQFIRAGMTSIGETVRTGNGKILGEFRTVTASAREVIEEKIDLLKGVGIGGISTLGKISEQVCQVHVGLNRIGIVQLGGLNPIAAATEVGIEIDNTAESGLIEFERLRSFWQIYSAHPLPRNNP